MQNYSAIKKLTWWQDEFWRHMVKKYPDLERGERSKITGKLSRESLRHKEAAELADALGDEIVWQKRTK